MYMLVTTKSGEEFLLDHMNVRKTQRLGDERIRMFFTNDEFIDVMMTWKDYLNHLGLVEKEIKTKK